jgi:P27 family predicted phage terminase small subunit
LHELHGRPGKRKAPKGEPIAGGNLFDPPGWLTAEQADEWLYIVDNAVPGLLTSVDRANLTAYVVAACLHRRATRELNKARSMFVSVGKNGAKQQHPALQVINRQALIMLKAAAEMGFTPSSRTRVARDGEVAPPNGKPATPAKAPAPGGLEGFIARNPDLPH